MLFYCFASNAYDNTFVTIPIMSAEFETREKAYESLSTILPSLSAVLAGMAGVNAVTLLSADEWNKYLESVSPNTDRFAGVN